MHARAATASRSKELGKIYGSICQIRDPESQLVQLQNFRRQLEYQTQGTSSSVASFSLPYMLHGFAEAGTEASQSAKATAPFILARAVAAEGTLFAASGRPRALACSVRCYKFLPPLSRITNEIDARKLEPLSLYENSRLYTENTRTVWTADPLCSAVAWTQSRSWGFLFSIGYTLRASAPPADSLLTHRARCPKSAAEPGPQSVPAVLDRRALLCSGAVPERGAPAVLLVLAVAAVLAAAAAPAVLAVLAAAAVLAVSVSGQ